MNTVMKSCLTLTRYLLPSILICMCVFGAPAQVVQARTSEGRQTLQAAGGAPECIANGTLLKPVVPPGYTWTWAFVANFDHAPLVNQTHGCLAIALFGNPIIQYTVLTCPVVGSLAAPIGNGAAVLDGGGYIQCDLSLVSQATPGMFRIQARTLMPSGSITHTLASSDAFSFQAIMDVSCATMKLSSTIGSMSYKNTTAGACGVLTGLGSRIEKQSPGLTAFKGWHFVNGANLGSTNVAGTFGLQRNVTIRMGAMGEQFTLDEVVVDPPGRCCSPG